MNVPRLVLGGVAVLRVPFVGLLGRVSGKEEASKTFITFFYMLRLGEIRQQFSFFELLVFELSEFRISMHRFLSILFFLSLDILSLSLVVRERPTR